MVRVTFLLSGVTLCAWLSICTHIGLAQQQPEEEADSLKSYEIDEVVTTGTRSYRKIIDVPFSIERIDQSQYKYDRKSSVNDVLGSIPGLFFQNRYGNHDVRISIRGFGSRSNSGIRGVRILLDGIPESEPDGQTRIEAIDFHSIGSIEVVKGNASSLYTNAPGGVINFINDITFPRSFAVNFNEFGSFDLRNNGFKAGVRTENYGFLLSYNYHHAKGFREHSSDNWHILNTVVESKPGDNSKLSVFGYYVDGMIRLPGSLTKDQFDQDPFQPNSRDVGRDAKRISTKSRLGLEFETFTGRDNVHQVIITLYGTYKYFERTAATYRIINRYGIGGSPRYVHHGRLFGRKNEFSFGGDLYYQGGPVEEFENIGGKKGDRNLGIGEERVGNVGFYFQERFNLIEEKLDLFLTARYDKVVFDTRNQILEVRSDSRRFEAFTPKAALNYKLTPTIAAYTSYGTSFDSPAGNELDNYPISRKPNSMLNPDLNPQKSRNFEIGVKGNVLFEHAPAFKIVNFEATFFNTVIDDEIIPFEVAGRVFFRNAAKTNRTGIEVGGSTEIVRGLRLRPAYTFSDFTYKTYVARSIEADTTDKSFAGNVVPSVPKHNLSLTLSYERTLVEGVTGFAKTSYSNVSGMYTDDANSEKSAGYQLINASLGFDLVLSKFNILVTGGMNNIADRRYVAFININSAQKEFYELGEPRNFFLGLNFGYTP